MDDECAEGLAGSDKVNEEEQKETNLEYVEDTIDGGVQNDSNINSNNVTEMKETSANEQAVIHDIISSEQLQDVTTNKNIEDDSDDDDIFMKSTRKNTSRKNILISDDESGCDNEQQPTLHYSDSETENNEEHTDIIPNKTSERPSIWDSDSKSSAKEIDSDNYEDSMKKKAKTKKMLKRKERVRSSNKISDSNSDSNDSSGEDETDKNIVTINKLKSLCDDDSQVSSASSDDSSRRDARNSDGGNSPNGPRERPQQRNAAIAAEDQMKKITSESQRLARDIYINVPYHRPKQHSLKEFMSRRTISKPAGYPGLQKAAAAIKMSNTDLALYARSLEERAEEAIKFFENENFEVKAENKVSTANVDIDSQSNNDTIETQSVSNEAADLMDLPQKKSSVEKSPLAANAEFTRDMSNKTDTTSDQPPTETIEGEINAESSTQFEVRDCSSSADTISDPIAGPSTKTIDNESNSKFSGFHTEETDLDKELEMMSVPIVRKKTMFLDMNAPRLSGSKGTVIDLNTNEINAEEKSGVDKLLERFLKNSGKYSTAADSIEISIFSSERGVLETHKIANQPAAVKDKEPKPGEAFLKLKNELSKKITDKRKEVLTKRIQETQKNNETDEELTDCEEEEEESDEQEEGDEQEEVGEQENAAEHQDDNEQEAGNAQQLFQLEASEDEGPLSEDEESLQMYEDEETDEENDGKDEQNDKPKRSRILAAFQDSDDDEVKIPSQTRLSDKCNGSPVKATQSTLSQNIFDTPPPKDLSQEKSDVSFDFMSSAAFNIKNSSNQFSSQTAIDTPMNLFSQENEADAIGESQLEALCSGTFVTQLPITAGEDFSQTAAISQLRKEIAHKPHVDDDDTSVPQPTTNEVLAALLSSDDESNLKNIGHRKKKLKKRAKPLGFSDDENNDSEEECVPEEAEAEGEDEEEDIEHYVEYDSDENEVKVTLKKKDVKLKASEFFENEAELSESEWGSADEDEKDLDKFEKELGDEDEFDREKLHSELERIRLRQQIDQDAREVRIIKEMLFEEEEDKGDRERKFRWKHLDNVNLNEFAASGDGDDAAGHESDDDNEAEWRRLRYEREQTLLNQQIAPSEPQDDVLPTAYDQENNDSITLATNSSSRRTAIVKNAVISPYIKSPFLIGKTASIQKGRKSFLGRDDKTLEKLLNLTKATTGGESVANTANTKGQYLFTATDQPQVLKRRSDNVSIDDESPNNIVAKKPRLSKGSKPLPKRMFELLN